MSDDMDTYARKIYELMVKISDVCEGHDQSVVAGALTTLLAKMAAFSADTQGLEKITTSLNAIYTEEKNKIRKVN